MIWLFKICLYVCKYIPQTSSTTQSFSWSMINTASPSKKRSICISDFMQTAFFYLGRFLKKLADDQCSSITKGSICHISHMYIQPFATAEDWPEIRCLREYLLCFIFADTAFLLGMAEYWYWKISSAILENWIQI